MEESVPTVKHVQYLIDEALKIAPTSKATCLQLLSDALTQTEKIIDISNQLFCLNEIADACEKNNATKMYVNTLNQAFEIVQAISDRSTKQAELDKIGMGYIQALHLANSQEDPEDLGFDQQDLNLDLVPYVCREIENHWVKIEIAELLRSNEKIKTLILEPSVKDSIESEKYEQAIAFIEASVALDFGDQGYWKQGWVIPGIVRHYMNFGGEENLLKLIEYIESPEIKISVLISIAKFYLDLEHDKEMFFKFLNQAYEFLENIEHENARAFTRDTLESIRVKNQ